MSISKIKVGSTDHQIIGSPRYATCSTAASTAAKVAALADSSATFALETGVRISVKFTNANSVASPTLNVASSGAKAIYWHGAALASGQYWQANAVLDFLYNGTQWELVGIAKDNNTTYSVATTSANGLMSSGDKSKLDGIASGANAYTHPTTSGNKHIPAGGSSGQILRWSADGTAVWGNDNNTTYSNFVKSGSGAQAGLVPAPSTTAGTTKYLREDGTWQVPPDTNTTYTFNGAVSTIKDNNLTASRALISDGSGKVAVSAVTSTELGYLDGVTSAIQAQLNGKAPSSHASTETTYGVGNGSNYGHVKLSDAINSTSDASLGIAASPVAVKAAYDKANHSHPYASSSHTHDDRYYTESEVDNKLADKANSSHGTHVSYGTSATAVGATASAGSASTVSRSDHTHSLSKSAVTTALGYTPPTTNTTYSVVSTSADGLAPKRDGSTTKFLRGDGAWAVPPDTNTTYSVATQSATGLMSAADKKKLDGIATGANNYTYTLPTASSSTLGGVKTGSNITNSSGTISLTKANVTSALGYTPPTTNTTYSAGTGLGLNGTTFSVSYGTSAGTACQGNDSRLSNARTPTAHNQAASTITAGTLAGQVVANATAVATVGTAQVRNIYAGTDDMTAGSTSLASGTIYFVYE